MGLASDRVGPVLQTTRRLSGAPRPRYLKARAARALPPPDQGSGAFEAHPRLVDQHGTHRGRTRNRAR